MKLIVFASSNGGKTKEIKSLLENEFQVVNLLDIGCTEEIPETADTFEGNALQKSTYVLENYQLDCFADDSGLEVEALNGEPGVYSARFSGSRDNEKNIELLLSKLNGINNRKAQFRTVISLLLDGKNYFFEGIVKGEIIPEKRGEGGFGYDPIFIPEGFNETFAELDASIKNKISHRAIATKKMIEFLKQKEDSKN
ncbi:non-canonical purine NTP diphosphatase [Pedobacter flavus]|uniref:dITP/XTP pyrophosphatase n=1 Tax=Pedobacter flavus TaxID=3113906 RepID=A0ABU7GYC7_9SPHI|nr:non-canonical purine NTP diphosphatase [Pedobacter sp. VNH31]MEE1884075.1 non-canonical purine NTP diphosphatase [Pedobacter sp. VNH31]